MSASVDTKVLIVEDEPLLRMLAIIHLEDEGFTVEEAANSHEAVHALRSVAGLHVLFTDVHIPGDMDGLELAHMTAREYPSMEMIIVSGRATLLPHELPTGAVFMPKPYELRHVVSHIRTVRGAA